MDIFIQQIINGLVLGSMYALVALGYTMVYGILNLINFAHGDVLMVGAMVRLSVHQACCRTTSPGLPGNVPTLCIALIIARVRLRGGRLHDRARRLPAAAQRAAAGAADHRDRRVDPAADAGDDHLEAATSCLSRSCCPPTRS